MMDFASKLAQVEFSEDKVDGGVELVDVTNEEDMIIAVCHIAECLAFNKAINLEEFRVSNERLKITDTLLSLLDFN